MRKNVDELVAEFRLGIEKAKADNKLSVDQRFRNFPAGCCGPTSELLARYLLDNGVKTELTYISGTYLDHSHAWLEMGNGHIIDITADQFRYYPELFNFNISVYIGQYSRTHKLFDVWTRDRCDNHYPLSDRKYLFQLSDKRLYDIIIESIDEL